MIHFGTCGLEKWVVVCLFRNVCGWPEGITKRDVTFNAYETTIVAGLESLGVAGPTTMVSWFLPVAPFPDHISRLFCWGWSSIKVVTAPLRVLDRGYDKPECCWGVVVVNVFVVRATVWWLLGMVSFSFFFVFWIKGNLLIAIGICLCVHWCCTLDSCYSCEFVD